METVGADSVRDTNESGQDCCLKLVEILKQYLSASESIEVLKSWKKDTG